MLDGRQLWADVNMANCIHCLCCATVVWVASHSHEEVHPLFIHLVLQSDCLSFDLGGFFQFNLACCSIVLSYFFMGIMQRYKSQQLQNYMILQRYLQVTQHCTSLMPALHFPGRKQWLMFLIRRRRRISQASACQHGRSLVPIMATMFKSSRELCSYYHEI